MKNALNQKIVNLQRVANYCLKTSTHITMVINVGGHLNDYSTTWTVVTMNLYIPPSPNKIGETTMISASGYSDEDCLHALSDDLQKMVGDHVFYQACKIIQRV